MSVLLSWHEKVCISLFPIKLLFPISAKYKDAFKDTYDILSH